jgi:hypothetical protein
MYKLAEERVLLRQLAAERQQIERENSEVIYAIANSLTLAKVEDAALQQGFRPATERVYVRRDAVTGADLTPRGSGRLAGSRRFRPQPPFQRS